MLLAEFIRLSENFLKQHLEGKLPTGYKSATRLILDRIKDSDEKLPSDLQPFTHAPDVSAISAGVADLTITQKKVNESGSVLKEIPWIMRPIGDFELPSREVFIAKAQDTIGSAFDFSVAKNLIDNDPFLKKTFQEPLFNVKTKADKTWGHILLLPDSQFVSALKNVFTQDAKLDEKTARRTRKMIVMQRFRFMLRWSKYLAEISLMQRAGLRANKKALLSENALLQKQIVEKAAQIGELEDAKKELQTKIDDTDKNDKAKLGELKRSLEGKKALANHFAAEVAKLEETISANNEKLPDVNFTYSIDEKLYNFIMEQLKITRDHLAIARNGAEEGLSEGALNQFEFVFKHCYKWCETNNEKRRINQKSMPFTHELSAIDMLQCKGEGDIMQRLLHLQVPVVFDQLSSAYEAPHAEDTQVQAWLSYAMSLVTPSSYRNADVSQDKASSYPDLNGALFNQASGYQEDSPEYWEQIFEQLKAKFAALPDASKDPNASWANRKAHEVSAAIWGTKSKGLFSDMHSAVVSAMRNRSEDPVKKEKLDKVITKHQGKCNCIP